MFHLRRHLCIWISFFSLVSGIIHTKADYAPDGISSIWFNRSDRPSSTSIQTLHHDWQVYPSKEKLNAYRMWRTLPGVMPDEPVLVIANPGSRRIQVSLDDQLLYQFGVKKQKIAADRAANAVHRIPLPPDATGQIITLELEGTHEPAPTAESPMTLIASSSVMLHDLLLSAAPHFALALLFVFVGLHAAMSWLIRRRYGMRVSPWFGIMTLTLGAARLIASSMEFLPPAEAAKVYYIGLLFMLLFPATLWCFMEQALGRGRWSLIRRCWQLQLIAACTLWLSDISGWLPFAAPTQALGNILIALQLCVGWIEGIRHIHDPDAYRRWTARGILILSAAGLVDIVVSFISGNPDFELYPIGLLALILILAWNQERAASEDQRTLRRQKEELQDHREKLEERVRERTAQYHEATLAAESASRAKSEFLANMSHEVRTPINAILGHAQLLHRTETENPSTASERGHIIRESAEHLLALINDILDLSRIEARRFSLDIGDTDLHDLLDGVLQMLRPRAEEKGLWLRLETDNRIPSHIETDPRRLRQVLINLLGNAIKFTCQGGATLRVTSTDTELIFEVIDTGPGLGEKNNELLFEPFERNDRDQRKEGTGLGLAISRKIARALGGDIQAQENPDGGSCFRFWCQYAPIGEQPQAAPSNELSAPSPRMIAPSPLPDDYESLSQAIRIGDIASVLQELPPLRTRHPEHFDFLNTIERLARSFEITALQHMVSLTRDNEGR